MKYSQRFETDYNWYLKYYNIFNFDAEICRRNKNGDKVVVSDSNGKSAKECFYLWDSKGLITPCREAEELEKILRCKGAINFNIKMWAEDRGKGFLGKLEFDEIIKEYKLLDWMINAVEMQKFKQYEVILNKKNL